MPNVILVKRKVSAGAPSPASLQTAELCYVLPDKKLYIKNLDATVTEIITNVSLRTVLTLGSAFASSTTTRVNVPNMNFQVTAGKKYEIKLVGSYQTDALTTGASIGFVLTSGTGNIIGFVTMAVSQATVATDLTATIRTISSSNTLAGSFITSTAVSVINSPHYFNGELIFDCLTSGVLNLQFASEVAASSAQINAGAVIIVDVLN
jgi:hypothetical protein